MKSMINNFFELRNQLKQEIFRVVNLSPRLYAIIFFCEETSSIRTRVLTRTETPVLMLEELNIDELIAYTNIQKELHDWFTSSADLPFPIKNEDTAMEHYQSVNYCID